MRSSDSGTQRQPRKSWRFQFRLGTIFLAITLVAVFLGWVEMKRREARRQGAAVAALRSRGAEVKYSQHPRTAFGFLLQWMGEDGFYVDSVRFGRDLPFGETQREAEEELSKFLNGSLSRLFRQARLADSDVEHLFALANLETVILSGSAVTDVGFRRVCELPSLKELRADGTRLSDAGFEHLANLSALRRLSLRHTAITDAGLVHLRELNSLTSLNLSRSAVTDAGVVHLRSLTELEDLDLSYTQTTDVGLRQLTLPKLSRLSLDSTRVTGEGVAHFQRLTELSLQKTELSDATLAPLRGLRCLRKAWLADTKITDAGVPQLLDFPDLLLMPTYGTQITERGRQILRERYPNVVLDFASLMLGR